MIPYSLFQVKSPGIRMAVIRDNRPVAIGKFSPWALEQILQSGDTIVNDKGQNLTVQKIERGQMAI